jgi:hypothetical protein
VYSVAAEIHLFFASNTEFYAIFKYVEMLNKMHPENFIAEVATNVENFMKYIIKVACIHLIHLYSFGTPFIFSNTSAAF